MLYIERKPLLPLRPFVRSFWYASTPTVERRHECVLPSGCGHIVVSLAQDFLTNCLEDRTEQRTAPALMVGQRSIYEIIATADLMDLAGAIFEPGALPAFVADRADLISNQNLPLDEVWFGYTDHLRSRMLEGSSPEARLCILEDCLTDLLIQQGTFWGWTPHPAVSFALEQFARESNHRSINDIARNTGWSERRFSQLFREQVGFPPKMWSRLQRFQRVVRQLSLGVEVRWAELAVEHGFYDQAHLANEFRAFSGMDLTTYSAQLHPPHSITYTA